MASFARLPRVVLSLGAAALLISMVSSAHAVTISWVTVGDPGNAADDTTYGAVAGSFQIMKFEWTNSQYVDYLNAVDPDGANPNSVYNADMGANVRGGISFDTNAISGSKYAARTNMGDKPVNYVSWWDAARVANWLQNGAQTYGSTDSSANAPQNTGAYTTGTVTSGTAPAVNPGARFYIPTENQWYKAAFYKGGSTNAGYWDYATQSDTAPTAVSATAVGTGTSGGVSPVISGNFANYTSAADWNSQNGNVTTVGTNGGPTIYQAFDMSGNIREWNDLTGAAGPTRGLRGGSWSGSAFDVSASDAAAVDPSSENSSRGFRLAAVPEPSACAMALAGLACGGYSMFRRRRAR
jgi:formylglycine-generating enzyme required for sulfatase activity